ncbi:MAG: TonB-dependent receptor [Bacteroidales bacterium]|nr:TonB-dependent receptor [Bacteroidales bacterium]
MKKNLYFFKPRLWVGSLVLLAFFLGLGTNSLYAQKTYTFSGKVINKSGETLPGVNVVVKGDVSHGTSTDVNGKFSISTPNAAETLLFSFVGAVSQEVQAKAGVPLTIVMEDKAIGLSELVVVGYGTQKKSVVTGAITSVKSKDLENVPIARVEQALQGRTSGVTIAASSGQPGAGSTVRVRGTTTINNSDPLYVVDGIVVDNGGIDYLNSSDIESIEVLKDAASCAIYGARAANGVILVSTKKGKAGSLLVNYSAYFGTQAPSKKLDLLNATQYATLQNEASVNSGGGKIFPDPESFGAGTDWQSAIFNNNAGIQNHELSVSGGNDRSTFYTSFGYFNQEGIVTSSISNYNKISVRMNSAHKVKDWLRFGNNFGYTHIKSKGSLNSNSEFGGPLASAINLDPITPLVITDPDVANSTPYSNHAVIRDADGNPYGISNYVGQEMTNPLAYEQTVQGNYGWSDNFVGDVYAEIEPVKGLKLKSDLGAKLAFYGGESFTPIFWLNTATSNPNTSYYRNDARGLIWSLENTASYSFKTGVSNFSVLLGQSVYVNNSRGTGVTYHNIPANTFEEASMNYSVANADRFSYGWEGAEYKLASVFARVNYDYDEKYLFTGIIRRDGSSRFGSNNKFGIFPSVSAGWVPSKENFWPKNEVVNFLKVRASYGITGNDRLDDFSYESLVGGGRDYTYGGTNYQIGYSPGAPSNPDLKWEQTIQSNIGFEANVLQDFTVVFDYFAKTTTGMLLKVDLPGYVGAEDGQFQNVAEMTNKGFELELTYRKMLGDVNLEVKGNTSYVKNEITDLGEKEYISGASFQASQYEISRLTEGYAIGSFYGFEVLGIFKKQSEILGYTDPATGNVIQPNAQTGDFKFADLNLDGKITGEDRKFIGDPTPSWSFGLTASAAYKGFDIVVFGQGVAGNQIFNAMRRLDVPTANWTTEALDRWTLDNPFTDFPRLVRGDPNKNFSNPSTFFLTSGTYFRVKNLQIGYTLPAALMERIGFVKARVYASSNNLLTLTKYKGFDPEIGGGSYGIDRGIYPQARSYMVGVAVTF